MTNNRATSSASEPDQQPVLFEESVSLDDLVQQSRQQQEPDAAELPCAINGLTSGLSGGVLGYAFGFCAIPALPTPLRLGQHTPPDTHPQGCPRCFRRSQKLLSWLPANGRTYHT